MKQLFFFIIILSISLNTIAQGNSGKGNDEGPGKEPGKGKGHAYGHDKGNGNIKKHGEEIENGNVRKHDPKIPFKYSGYESSYSQAKNL